MAAAPVRLRLGYGRERERGSGRSARVVVPHAEEPQLVVGEHPHEVAELNRAAAGEQQHVDMAARVEVDALGPIEAETSSDRPGASSDDLEVVGLEIDAVWLAAVQQP